MPSVITAVAGETKILHCNAVGEPKPTTTWSPPVSIVTTMWSPPPNVNNIIENKDKDLVMINVEKKDQGPYQCTATNVFGTDTYTVLLQVKVYEDKGTVTCDSVFLPCELMCGVHCPNDCPLASAPVYGTGRYDVSSSVCRSGVHSGVIKTRGGEVIWENAAASPPYTASTRNGVSSSALRELYDQTKERLKTIEDYLKPNVKIHTIWECEFDQQKYPEVDPHLKPIDKRDAFYGGRTETIQLYNNLSDLKDTFMKYKQEASGCKCDPKYCKPDCENDKECKTKIQYIIDNAAYNLDIDKVKHNSGLRFIAKICLNNLWGHFGMRDNFTQKEYCFTLEHITKIVFNENIKI
ncbi:unnamed protein product [Mytilus coruscus]|uniref:DNA-directed DNA polymerase n=1 Tax=Mytilus coruscus TaxID=42192 RepID=A0A6J8EMH5_MYTCO|nr:unnamed protein product [Mytilus coruscus]